MPLSEKRQRELAGITKGIGIALSPYIKRIADLERRLAELEQQQKSIQYCGTWESGRKYEKGNFVTDGGSVWHCDRDTTQRPGPGDAWTLAVKRGRDA